MCICTARRGCISTAGDYALYELAALVRRYPLAEINSAPYIIEAVEKYLKEARGCGPQAKQLVARRVLEVLKREGIDPKNLVLRDLHGVSREVAEVIEMLNIPVAKRRHTPRQTEGYTPVWRGDSYDRRYTPRQTPVEEPRGATRRGSKVGEAIAVAIIAMIILMWFLATHTSLTLPTIATTPTTASPTFITLTHITVTPPTITLTPITVNITPITITLPTITVTPITITTSVTQTQTARFYATQLSLGDEVVKAAVDALNKYRLQEGVPPVEFIPLKTPLYRAVYMYNNSYLSHYSREGLHPGYYYTLLDGGIYAVEENAGVVKYYNCRGYCVKPKEDVAKLIYGMIYDDAESNWGHRDSLLDPCHNKVSIAAAWDGKSLYAAIYMVASWADWISPPRYDPDTKTFSLRGYIKLPPSEKGFGPFYPIYIYRDVPRAEYYYRRSYSKGSLYAGVLPGEYPGSYIDIATIRAERYVVRRTDGGWYVDISFRLDLPKDGALYTIAMTSAPTEVKWRPLADTTRLETCRIFEYTIRT
ncbi:MAG: CAP domain-containing protein [Pyrobaculum sp.]